MIYPNLGKFFLFIRSHKSESCQLRIPVLFFRNIRKRPSKCRFLLPSPLRARAGSNKRKNDGADMIISNDALELDDNSDKPVDSTFFEEMFESSSGGKQNLLPLFLFH